MNKKLKKALIIAGATIGGIFLAMVGHDILHTIALHRFDNLYDRFISEERRIWEEEGGYGEKYDYTKNKYREPLLKLAAKYGFDVRL